MELEFLGGAGTVTGSKTVVRAGDTQVLVDCGLFQGLKHLRRRNWSPLAIEASAVDAIVLTHAHLDHSGHVPAFVRHGFRGPVYASPGTIALCRVLWPDSGRLQEEDAAYAQRQGFSKHRDPRPLYTEEEALRALEFLEPVEFHQPFDIGTDVQVVMAPAGHILGASVVRISGDDTSVLFSGDLGRPNDLVMNPPSTALTAETLVLESTYGDQCHPPTDAISEIGKIVRRTVGRGGTVLIPSFAVGRTQAVLVALWRLHRAGELPDVPVFLDSPMAVAATNAYFEHPDEHRLKADEVEALTSIAHHVASVDESKALNERFEPCVIVSAAGMLTGGRVLHHFARLAPSPRNTVVLVGYQAVGTRGASLLAGERRIKVHGSYVPVRCRVEHLDMLSAHADQQELIDWVRALEPAPSTIVLNHGESNSAETLRRRLDEDLGIPCEVAVDGARVTLAPFPPPARRGGTPERVDEAGARLERILMSESYVRADRDLDLLASDELRASRLMLEYLKVDLALRREEVDALVAVFGSSRIQDPEASDHPGATSAWNHFYAEARELGGQVGTERYDGTHQALVVTGGGPGIMEAANRGSFDVGARTVGLNITLEHEQLPNTYVTPELTFQFRYFGVRKMHFLTRAVALVLFPGGFGTADELYETLTLMQSGKMRRIPVVLVGSDFWSRLLPLDLLATNGFIDDTERDLCRVVETGMEAWRAIQDFYAERPAEAAQRGPFVDP